MHSECKWYRSKCPECGNVDNLTEMETKKIVHCQRCYNHYKFEDKSPFFKGYHPALYFSKKEGE